MFTGKHVLAIDDSKAVQTYLHSVLSPLGATVESATTAREGVTRCASQRYDVILLELLLPDVNGIEALKQIRKDNDYSAIVILTDHGGIRSAVTAMQLGADDYVQKQDVLAVSDNHAEILEVLERAASHRASLVAQKQSQEVGLVEFYASVAQDLQPPVNSILTMTEMLVKESFDSLSLDHQQSISVIYAMSQRLSNLANHYRDMAQVDEESLLLELADLDLRDVIKASALLFEPQARFKRQSFALDLPYSPLPVHADSGRLRQAFDNLLSNAIKYTPEGGRITVQLQAESGRAVLRVSDTGIGIPPSLLPALLTPYQSTPETVGSLRGISLGLLVSKNIIEAHGGIIQVESEGVPGKGSLFTISLPLLQKGGEPAGASLGSRGEDIPDRFSGDPELRRLFFEESRQHIHTLQGAISCLYFTPQDKQLVETAYRVGRTLKNNAKAMQQAAIYTLAAEIDEVLEQAIRGSLVLTQTHVGTMARLLDKVARTLVDTQSSIE